MRVFVSEMCACMRHAHARVLHGLVSVCIYVRMRADACRVRACGPKTSVGLLGACSHRFRLNIRQPSPMIPLGPTSVPGLGRCDLEPKVHLPSSVETPIRPAHM